MKALIGTAISLLMIAALMSGDDRFIDFAYYFQLVINILGWLLFIPMFNNETSRNNFKSRLWLTIPIRSGLLFALVYAGFPGLAVSSLLLLSFMVVASTIKTPKEEAKP